MNSKPYRMVGLALVWAGCAFASDLWSADNLRFTHLSSAQGLSENTVTSIAQDHQGFLWFGTQDGLNRFDGIELKVFKADPGSAYRLAEDFINALYVDRSGNLWVGTFSGGLNRLDPRTGGFQVWRSGDGPQAISDEHVTAIYGDGAGFIWIGTAAGGLNRVDPRSGVVDRFLASDGGLGANSISAVTGDGEGGLWVATLGGGLSHRSEEGRWRTESHRASDPDSLSSDQLTSLLFDSAGRLWVGTHASGLNLRLAEGRFRRFTHQYRDPHSLASNAIHSLYQDRRGRIWVATALGLDRIDVQSGHFFHSQSVVGDRFSLPYNEVLSVFQDRIGSLWVGTGGGGVSRHSEGNERFQIYHRVPGDPHSLSHNVVWSIAEQADGRLWLGTYEGGLNVRDPSTGRFSHFLHDPQVPTSLSNNDVRALLTHRDGTLWAGTKNGLNRMREDATGFDRFVHDPTSPNSLSHNYVKALLEDQAGRLWVGTYGGGLNLMTRPGHFEVYRHQPGNPHSLSDDRVYTLHEDGRGRLWVGTHGGGLNLFEDGRFETFRHVPDDPASLASDRVLSLAEDPGGRLWVGTSSGLHRLDLEQRQFERYGLAQGLPDEVIYGVLADDRGDLWMSSNKGLMRLRPASGEISHFPLEDFLYNTEFNGGVSFRDRRGRLIFGGVEGALAFDPRAMHVDKAEPVLVLTDFMLYNVSQLPRLLDHSSPLGAPVGQVEEVVLDHTQSVFSIVFAALDSVTPRRLRYSYRLEGLDDRWIETGAEHRIATYTGLRPGQYTFRVRAGSALDAWGSDEAQLSVRVLAPPWRTAWAYAVYVAVVGLLILMAWLRYHQRMRERQRAQAAIRTSEERLSLALWGSGDELWDWDLAKGRMFRSNRMGALEYPKDESWKGVESFSQYVHPEDLDNLGQALRLHMDGHSEHYEASYRAKTSDGRWIWVLDRGKVVARDTRGQAARVSGTLKNISRLKDTEQALRTLNDKLDSLVQERTNELNQRSSELETANSELRTTVDQLYEAQTELRRTVEELYRAQAELVESKKMASLGRLVAGVAHEINTPLGVGITAISVLISKARDLREQMQTEALGSSDLEQFVQATEQASDLATKNLMRASELVQSFKQVAVDQSSETIRPFQLDRYLAEIIETFGPRIDPHRHRVKIDCPTGQEIISRPGAIYQIVVNLVVNSLIHGFDGRDEGLISLGVRQEGSDLCLCYQDDGVGLTREVRQHIFEPFFTTKRGAGGSGLGMHLVFNLVTQSLQGRILCESEPGRGVRFEIRFPVQHPLFGVKNAVRDAGS